MITKTIPAPQPARYVWDGAVGSADINCKAIDPTGVTTKTQNRARPAIGLIAGHAGTVLYQDSAGKNVVVQANAGVFVPGDFAKILHTGKAYDAAAGADTGTITPTAYGLVLYWDL